jgi:hypothetical protein
VTVGPPGRSEAGTTLVELIVTVAIMGFAMLALMGGIGTSIIFADIQRNDASIGLVLTSAAEKLVGDTTPYVPCAPTAAYDDQLKPPPVGDFTAPDGYVVTVDAVWLWDVPTNTFVDMPAACTAPDSGLQLIRLRAESTGGQRGPRVQTLELVKRLVVT